MIALNPETAEDYTGRILQARVMRAQLNLAQEKFAAARDDFTAILEKVPKRADILRARAILNWQNLKDFDAALADFKEYASLI